MIYNFRTWKILEHLGDGTETFSQKLDIYGKYKNLDVYSPKSSWDVEEGTGEITYSVAIDATKSGIKEIQFEILEIETSLKIWEESSEPEGKISEKNFHFGKKDIVSPKIILNNLPFYLQNLSLDFSKAVNPEGEIDLKKVKIEMEIGGEEKIEN